MMTVLVSDSNFVRGCKRKEVVKCGGDDMVGLDLEGSRNAANELCKLRQPVRLRRVIIEPRIEGCLGRELGSFSFKILTYDVV